MSLIQTVIPRTSWTQSAVSVPLNSARLGLAHVVLEKVHGCHCIAALLQKLKIPLCVSCWLWWWWLNDRTWMQFPGVWEWGRFSEKAFWTVKIPNFLCKYKLYRVCWYFSRFSTRKYHRHSGAVSIAACWTTRFSGTLAGKVHLAYFCHFDFAFDVSRNVLSLCSKQLRTYV